MFKDKRYCKNIRDRSYYNKMTENILIDYMDRKFSSSGELENIKERQERIASLLSIVIDNLDDKTCHKIMKEINDDYVEN